MAISQRPSTETDLTRAQPARNGAENGQAVASNLTRDFTAAPIVARAYLAAWRTREPVDFHTNQASRHLGSC